MGLGGFFGWLVFAVIGLFIHPLVGGALFVLAVWLYWEEWKDVFGTGKPKEPQVQLPVRRTSDIATRFDEARGAIQYQKELVKDAMTARREMEESAARELRILIENLIADRNRSNDPEVRKLIAEYNRYQIHGTANDFHRLLRSVKAKQDEITYSVKIDEADETYDYYEVR